MTNDAEWIARIAREAAEQVIRDHTVDLNRLSYFAPDDDKLITYVFHRTLMQAIQVFGERLNRVERPWYKRWFCR